jgi:hypothetical protein
MGKLSDGYHSLQVRDLGLGFSTVTVEWIPLQLCFGFFPFRLLYYLLTYYVAPRKVTFSMLKLLPDWECLPQARLVANF